MNVWRPLTCISSIFGHQVVPLALQQCKLIDWSLVNLGLIEICQFRREDVEKGIPRGVCSVFSDIPISFSPDFLLQKAPASKAPEQLCFCTKTLSLPHAVGTLEIDLLRIKLSLSELFNCKQLVRKYRARDLSFWWKRWSGYYSELKASSDAHVLQRYSFPKSRLKIYFMAPYLYSPYPMCLEQENSKDDFKNLFSSCRYCHVEMDQNNMEEIRLLRNKWI